MVRMATEIFSNHTDAYCLVVFDIELTLTSTALCGFAKCAVFDNGHAKALEVCLTQKSCCNDANQNGWQDAKAQGSKQRDAESQQVGWLARRKGGSNH